MPDLTELEPSSQPVASKWIYRWSLLVTLLTFPLIWLGGLVTTHDAGMAVPDWPGTFGYNLFLYPWSTWLYGPFDLFVEHGHRLLASLVGVIAIGLCIVAYRTERRVWLRNCCFGLLAAIIAQGLLGGFRVLMDARTAAMIHGCSGPLVFAFGAFIVMASSNTWHAPPVRIRSKWFDRCSLLLLILCIGQLFVGAQLRHAQPAWLPALFLSLVHTHLLLATLISITVILIFITAWCRARNRTAGLRLPASLLMVAVMGQVLLGFGTWIANYATPWIDLTPWLARYTIQGKGFWESMIVTGHQATGSLLIVFSLWLVSSVYRRVAESKSKSTKVENEMGAEQYAAPIAIGTGTE
jgi:heme a synthase